MSSWRDRFNQLGGKTRLAVCRVFVHLRGSEVATLLGTLHDVGRGVSDAEGDLEVMGEGLSELCQSLLQHQTYWYAAANEGDVFWDEGEASDYVQELFMDSAQRYLSNAPEEETETLTLPVSQNLVIMITIAATGELPALETDLSNLSALAQGLKTIAALGQGDSLRAAQVHFSPARFGDDLSDDQILQQFPELIPL